MTHKEKKALLDAAELIATGWCRFSCDAIYRALHRDGRIPYQYSRFYGQEYSGLWKGLLKHEGKFQGRRILMILLFREVGLEGIGLSE